MKQSNAFENINTKKKQLANNKCNDIYTKDRITVERVINKINNSHEKIIKSYSLLNKNNLMLEVIEKNPDFVFICNNKDNLTTTNYSDYSNSCFNFKIYKNIKLFNNKNNTKNLKIKSNNNNLKNIINIKQKNDINDNKYNKGTKESLKQSKNSILKSFNNESLKKDNTNNKLKTINKNINLSNFSLKTNNTNNTKNCNNLYSNNTNKNKIIDNSNFNINKKYLLSKIKEKRKSSFNKKIVNNNVNKFCSSINDFAMSDQVILVDSEENKSCLSMKSKINCLSNTNINDKKHLKNKSQNIVKSIIANNKNNSDKSVKTYDNIISKNKIDNNNNNLYFINKDYNSTIYSSNTPINKKLILNNNKAVFSNNNNESNNISKNNKKFKINKKSNNKLIFYNNTTNNIDSNYKYDTSNIVNTNFVDCLQNNVKKQTLLNNILEKKKVVLNNKLQRQNNYFKKNKNNNNNNSLKASYFIKNINNDNLEEEDDDEDEIMENNLNKLADLGILDTFFENQVIKKNDRVMILKEKKLEVLRNKIFNINNKLIKSVSNSKIKRKKSSNFKNLVKQSLNNLTINSLNFNKIDVDNCNNSIDNNINNNTATLKKANSYGSNDSLKQLEHLGYNITNRNKIKSKFNKCKNRFKLNKSYYNYVDPVLNNPSDKYFDKYFTYNNNGLITRKNNDKLLLNSNNYSIGACNLNGNNLKHNRLLKAKKGLLNNNINKVIKNIEKDNYYLDKLKSFNAFNLKKIKYDIKKSENNENILNNYATNKTQLNYSLNSDLNNINRTFNNKFSNKSTSNTKLNSFLFKNEEHTIKKTKSSFIDNLYFKTNFSKFNLQSNILLKNKHSCNKHKQSLFTDNDIDDNIHLTSQNFNKFKRFDIKCNKDLETNNNSLNLSKSKLIENIKNTKRINKVNNKNIKLRIYNIYDKINKNYKLSYIKSFNSLTFDNSKNDNLKNNVLNKQYSFLKSSNNFNDKIKSIIKTKNMSNKSNLNDINNSNIENKKPNKTLKFSIINNLDSINNIYVCDNNNNNNNNNINFKQKENNYNSNNNSDNINDQINNSKKSILYKQSNLFNNSKVNLNSFMSMDNILNKSSNNINKELLSNIKLKKTLTKHKLNKLSYNCSNILNKIDNISNTIKLQQEIEQDVSNFKKNEQIKVNDPGIILFNKDKEKLKGKQIFRGLKSYESSAAFSEVLLRSNHVVKLNKDSTLKFADVFKKTFQAYSEQELKDNNLLNEFVLREKLINKVKNLNFLIDINYKKLNSNNKTEDF